MLLYRLGIKEANLNELIHNDAIDIIMAAIGGNNSNSLLPYIDYEYLKKHPKMIVGYADTSAILLRIYAQTGIITLASSLGELVLFVDDTYRYFQKILEVKITYEYKIPIYWTAGFINWAAQNKSKQKYENEWLCIKEGVVEGRLIGGNLNTMEGFFGTVYMPNI